MPELTVYRNNAAPPPMVCMYCGAPATTTTEWREVNRKFEKTGTGGGGGTEPMPVPAGDDPVSAVITVLMLPFVLWELFTGLIAALGAVVGYLSRPRPTSVPPSPPTKELPTTLVVVTACNRHRRFRDRFVWAGLAAAVALAALWVGAVRETRRAMGTEEVGPAVTLLLASIFATVLVPLALSVWYTFAGPVVVERVTEDGVVLDRVRKGYFDATGLKPSEAA